MHSLNQTAKYLLPILLVGLSCQNIHDPKTSTLIESGFQWTAPQLQAKMELAGFVCLREGRELYPFLYDCSKEKNLHVYVYANDRSQIEGVRVFGPTKSDPDWITETLELVFQPPITSKIQRAMESTKYQPSVFHLDGFVFEYLKEDDRSIFRISPSDAIRS